MNKKLFFPILIVFALAVAAPAFSQAPQGQFDRTLKVTGTPDIEITTGSGDITVRTGDATTVRVIGKIRASGMDRFFGNAQEKIKRIEANPPIQQTGSLIRIGRIEDPDLRRNISISYEVTLPANTNLRSNTGSGNQDVEGLSAPVKASTGSGDVTVRRVSAEVRASTGSGNVRAQDVSGAFNGETGSGDIEVRGGGTGDVFVSTGSGNINVESMKGALRARTGSGDVRVNGVATSSWDVQTGSGNIALNLPSNAGFELNAETSSGNINVNREVTVSGQINRHRMRGKVGGGGTLLSLRTGSGDIDIR